MPSGALERAVDLLHHIGRQPAGPTVAELAIEAGMPTSTAYRLLAELEQHGLVQRGPDSTIALGTRLVALGRTAEAGLRERVVEPAAAVMAELSDEVGETVLLTAPCALEAIVLHVVEAEATRCGSPTPCSGADLCTGGASGKILAAFLEPAERRRLADAVGAPGLAAELDEVRRAGIAVTVGELDDGAAAVAAPILDRRGRLVAGLSVAGPEQRIAADVPALAAAVTAVAAKVQRAHQG